MPRTGVLPAKIFFALLRLDRLELAPSSVEQALTRWQRIAADAGRLDRDGHSDYLEFIGPMNRDVLQSAILALSGPARRSLAALVAQADDAIQAQTRHDPSRPDGPWWWQLLVH